MRHLTAFLLSLMLFASTAMAKTEHVVQRGETISSIAKKYKVTETALLEENPSAKDFFYTGMVLVIPEASMAESAIASSDAQLQNEASSLSQSNVPVYTNPGISGFEPERVESVFELIYTANTFEDIKASGYYGIGWTTLPWKVEENIYAGFHFSPVNFNYGLSDFNIDVIKLGPAIGYYFTPRIFISAPLDLTCVVYFGDNNKSKTSWGLSLAPSLYIGSKAGIFIGPNFNVAFTGGSKVHCGFRAGIYF